MSNPRLSIIMGVYNGERHVQKAILSLLVQDFEDFELIIVNDGSTDSSLEKIKQIEDPRIVIIDQENQGLTKSLNNAIKIAKGEFIARQDADDISIFNRFSKQLAIFEKEPSLGLLGSSMYISNPRGLFNEVFFYPESNESIKKAIYSYNPFVHGSIVIRKSVLDSLGGYNEAFRYVQDYELWSRVVQITKCMNYQLPLYARLRDSDCSEVAVDKTVYVAAIQKELKKNKIDRCSTDIENINPVNLYPYLGWPIYLAKPLSMTYKKMKALGKKNGCDISDFAYSDKKYFPWF